MKNSSLIKKPRFPNCGKVVKKLQPIDKKMFTPKSNKKLSKYVSKPFQKKSKKKLKPLDRSKLDYSKFASVIS